MLSPERKAYLAGWRAKSRDKTRAAQRKYYATNKEKCKAATKASVAKNPQPSREASRKFREANPEKVRDIRKRSYNKCREVAIRRVRTRAGKLRHGALWTTLGEQIEINGLYLFSECFPWFEVDHIVPLNGKRVSGLHVLKNLQVLPRKDNRAKGNKFCPAVVYMNDNFTRA